MDGPSVNSPWVGLRLDYNYYRLRATNGINLNQWYHIAVTNTVTSTGYGLLTLFLDGIKQGSNYYLKNSVIRYIGNHASYAQTDQVIDDLFYIKSVLYTNDFTPPNKPFN